MKGEGEGVFTARRGYRISQEIPLGWVAWWISGKKQMSWYTRFYSVWPTCSSYQPLIRQGKPMTRWIMLRISEWSTHLSVWLSDVRAARAVCWAGAGQGRPRHIKHVFRGRSVKLVPVLETHLGAGWNDPSSRGGGRQASDVYRAEEQKET